MRMLDSSRRRAVVTGTFITAACAALAAAAIVATPSGGSVASTPRLDRGTLTAVIHGATTTSRSTSTTTGRIATSTTAPTPQTTTATSTAPSNAPCQGTTPLGLSGAWNCTFDDEFNGTSLNRSLWVPQLTAKSGYVAGPVCYVDDPSTISVSGGYLNRSVHRAHRSRACPGSRRSTSPAWSRPTDGFHQTYGAFEVSAKLPPSTASGLQETLWLFPVTRSRTAPWPYSGEIDFAEFYSQYAGFDIPYIHYVSPGESTLDRSERHHPHLHRQPEHVQHLRGRLDADLHHDPLQRHGVPRRPSHDGLSTPARSTSRSSSRSPRPSASAPTPPARARRSRPPPRRSTGSGPGALPDEGGWEAAPPALPPTPRGPAAALLQRSPRRRPPLAHAGPFE